MNPIRWILVVPLLLSVMFFIGTIDLTRRLQSVDYRPAWSNPKAIEWHAKAIRSNDPEVLRIHSEKLWNSLKSADEVAIAGMVAGKKGVSAILWASVVSIMFCTLVFIKAKTDSRTTSSSQSSSANAPEIGSR